MFENSIHDSNQSEIIFRPLQFVIIFCNPNEPWAICFLFLKCLFYSEKFQ